MKEADFQATVVQLARLCRWTVHHQHDSRRSRRGLPDLLLWRPGAFLMRELKSDTGRLTNEQVITISELEAAGVDVAVWRPRQWDEIEATLRRTR